MKSIKLNLLIALGLVFLLSESAQTQFVRTMGGGNDEGGVSVVQTSDGGLVVTGWASRNQEVTYDKN
jgi:hypothetical protein